MSRFFVGQRVRKIGGVNAIGATGRFVEYVEFGDEFVELTADFDCRISVDSPWLSQTGEVRPPSATPYCISGHWTPILPEGHKPSEFTTLRDLMDSLEGVRA